MMSWAGTASACGVYTANADPMSEAETDIEQRTEVIQLEATPLQRSWNTSDRYRDLGGFDSRLSVPMDVKVTGRRHGEGEVRG